MLLVFLIFVNLLLSAGSVGYQTERERRR